MPGDACGIAGVAEEPAACVVCGQPTYVRTLCGAPRRFRCVDVETYGARDRQWLAERALAARNRPAGTPRSAGAPQPALRALLADRWPTLPPAEVDRAVALWNGYMRSIPYGGGHRTAIAILTGTLHHHQIPAVPPFDPAWLAPLADGPRWSARSWLADGPIPDGGALAGFDVNGMYLSAAASDLGTGAPELVEWPDDKVLKLPGWVKVAALEDAPHGIGARWVEGMWVPTPLVGYLVERGAQVLMPAALVWSRFRRWLDPHVDLMRAARAALIADGGPAAVAVLAVVKDLYTRMFGGLLRSDQHNTGPALNHHWAAQVPAMAQARMLRGIDQARAGTLVGVYADAAWWRIPHGWAHPPGLILSTQLGKWKPAGRVPWTAELAEHHRAGRGEPIRKALADAR